MITQLRMFFKTWNGDLVKSRNICTAVDIVKVFTFMLLCIVTDLFLNNQPDALIIPILFCYETPHVSDIFSAHHHEFSTVNSALVSFMQVSDDRFQAESGWNRVPS